MPMPCLKCNGFGHIAEKWRGKERCAKCGKEHNTSSCSITNAIAMKCARCNGNHSAASKICPMYLREAQVLKYQTEKELTYAKTCRKYNHATNRLRNADARQSQSLSNFRKFPPQPASNEASQSMPGLTCNRSNTNLKNMTSRKAALNLMKTASIYVADWFCMLLYV